MQKIWNFTYYSDGELVGERNGLGEQEAIAELYRLSRGETPAAPVGAEQVAPPAETGELALVA